MLQHRDRNWWLIKPDWNQLIKLNPSKFAKHRIQCCLTLKEIKSTCNKPITHLLLSVGKGTCREPLLKGKA
jgi:hypothetical protein